MVLFVKIILNETNLAKIKIELQKMLKKDCRNFSALTATFAGQEHKVTHGTESTVSGKRIGMIMMGTREALALTPGQLRAPSQPRAPGVPPIHDTGIHRLAQLEY